MARTRGGRVGRAAALSAAVAAVAAALALPAVAPAAKGDGACSYLTPTIASSLLKNDAYLFSPGTVQACVYAPVSERDKFDDDAISVATFQVLPVVARKGKARYLGTVKTLAKKAPAGTTGFKRATVRVEAGEATYTYVRAGGIGSGIAVLRSGDVLALLVVDIKRKASFTATDLQKAVSTILAEMESR